MSVQILDRVLQHVVMFILPLAILVAPDFAKLNGKLKRIVGAVILGIVCLKDVMPVGPNYFEVLGVENHAEDADVYSAFKKMESRQEGDRDDDDDDYDESVKDLPKITAREFARASRAFTVLRDSHKRKNYLWFADVGDDVTESDFLNVLGFVCVSALICYCAMHVLTYRAWLQPIRIWVVVYLAAVAAIDIYVRFEDKKMLNWIPVIGNRLVFEQLIFLRGMFPTYVGVLVFVQAHLWQDPKIEFQDLVRKMLQTNNSAFVGMQEFFKSNTVLAITHVGRQPGAPNQDLKPIPATSEVLEPPKPSELGSYIHKGIGLLVALSYIFGQRSAAPAADDDDSSF